MKSKLFLLALVAALSFSTQAQVKMENNGLFKTGKVSHVASMKALNAKIVSAPMLKATRDEVPAGYAKVTLSAGDIWGDGSGYQMLLDADANAYGTLIPETGALTTDGDASDALYAEFEYKIPENADGYLATTNIVFDAEVSILVPAGVYDWCITNPTPGDRMWISSSQGPCPGRYDDFEFVDGMTYIFTIGIYGSNDGVALTVLEPGVALTTPENLVAEPGDTFANISWEDNDDILFNLRYRVYNPNEGGKWDFEDDAQLDGWMIFDGDGDGDNWYYTTNDLAHSGQYVLASDSYYWGALYPDNWLISPEVMLNNELSFWASGSASSWYDEVFRVYVGPADWTSVDEFIPVSDDMVTNYGMTEYTFDLSACELAGQRGVFAIRHYNCSDVYTLLIDDVKVGEAGNEWVYVEGIDDVNALIEGLTPETTYEVQVQSTGNAGFSSEWTESTLFTTLATGETPTEKTGAPTFNGYTTDGIHAYFVEIIPTEPSTIYFRVQYPDGTWTEWAEYEDILAFTGNGKHRVEAYAVAPGKLPSEEIAYEFVVAPTGIDEMNAGKTVANVRYFNMAGQEMRQADGMTIVVTTFTDGTTSTAKVIK
jgi:hypothetical protein